MSVRRVDTAAFSALPEPRDASSAGYWSQMQLARRQVRKLEAEVEHLQLRLDKEVEDSLDTGFFFCKRSWSMPTANAEDARRSEGAERCRPHGRSSGRPIP